jgi:hypothetical protein
LIEPTIFQPFAPKNRLNRNSGDFTGASPDKKENGSEKLLPSSATSPPGAASSARSETSPAAAVEMRPLRSVLKRPKSVISQISESDLEAVIAAKKSV